MMLVLKILRRLGIDVAPYIVYVEQGRMPQAGAGNRFEQSPINAANIDAVLGRHGSRVNSGKWRDRTDSGDYGLLLEDRGDLVGYTWASERWFLGIDNRPLFELAAGEAYLFDTFVENPYRGKGIAGLLRELMCARLAAVGRDTLYSFTLVVNKPARRFKEKLAASPVELRVRVRLFGRWFADGRLRRWLPRVPVRFKAGRLRRRLRSP